MNTLFLITQEQVVQSCCVLLFAQLKAHLNSDKKNKYGEVVHVVYHSRWIEHGNIIVMLKDQLVIAFEIKIKT